MRNIRRLSRIVHGAVAEDDIGAIANRDGVVARRPEDIICAIARLDGAPGHRLELHEQGLGSPRLSGLINDLRAVGIVGSAQQDRIRVQQAGRQIRLQGVAHRVERDSPCDRTELGQHHIAMPCHAIGIQHWRAIRVEGAGDPPLADEDDIIAGANPNRIRAEAADDLVAAIARRDVVIAALAEDAVHAVASDDMVIPTKQAIGRDLTDQIVERSRIARPLHRSPIIMDDGPVNLTVVAQNHIVPVTNLDGVIADGAIRGIVVADDVIVAIACGDAILAGAAEHDVIAIIDIDRVISAKSCVRGLQGERREGA